MRHLTLDKLGPNSKFSLQAFEAYSWSCKCLIHTIPWSFSNKSYIFFFLKIGRRTIFNSSPALHENLNVYLFEVNRFSSNKSKDCRYNLDWGVLTHEARSFEGSRHSSWQKRRKKKKDFEPDQRWQARQIDLMKIFMEDNCFTSSIFLDLAVDKNSSLSCYRHAPIRLMKCLEIAFTADQGINQDFYWKIRNLGF